MANTLPYWARYQDDKAHPVDMTMQPAGMSEIGDPWKTPGLSSRLLFTIAMLILLGFLAAAATGCAVDSGAVVTFEKTAPDGSTLKTTIERKFEGGKVDAHCAYDPETGAFSVDWSSDVDLAPAVAASKIQVDAQAALIGTAVQAAITAGLAAAGVPPLAVVKPIKRPAPEIEVAPSDPPAAAWPRAGVGGGMGPPEEDHPGSGGGK